MVIGIDLDEVLADFINSFLKFYNKKNNTSFQRNKISCSNIWKIWGETQEKIMEEVYDFYETHYFENIEPIAGAIEGIDVLSQKHELKIITSRQNNIKRKTKDWIEKNFSNKFSEICFANHFAPNGSSIKKSEICFRESVDVMIEDSPDYATDCASNGIKVLLLDCPWNRSTKSSEKITRVQSWGEIIEKINATRQLVRQ